MVGSAKNGIFFAYSIKSHFIEFLNWFTKCQSKISHLFLIQLVNSGVLTISFFPAVQLSNLKAMQLESESKSRGIKSISSIFLKNSFSIYYHIQRRSKHLSAKILCLSFTPGWTRRRDYFVLLLNPCAPPPYRSR